MPAAMGSCADPQKVQACKNQVISQPVCCGMYGCVFDVTAVAQCGQMRDWAASKLLGNALDFQVVIGLS